MLYKDRGMAKWQGLILAEHKKQIQAAVKKYNSEVARKNQMAQKEIATILQDAFNNHKLIKIQLNALTNGQYQKDLIGTVKGFENGILYINTNADLMEIEVESIRHLDVVVNKKWFE